MTGSTQSTQSTFPVTVGPDLTNNGGADAFVAKISSTAPTAVFLDSNTSIRLLSLYNSPLLYDGGRLFARDPAASQTAQGHTVVAACDNWGSLWASVFSAGTQSWGTWTYLAGIFSTDPVMTTCPDGSLYLIGKDNWNSLWSGRIAELWSGGRACGALHRRALAKQ